MAAATRFVPCGIVTLTTDFGTSDGYVGAMKGVLLREAPGLGVFDLAHGVEPQNVSHAAAVLRTACPWYPAGTVHLGVVDPGVGTERAGLVVLAGGHAFVGPDNGLFGLVALALGGMTDARRIDPTGALAAIVSATPSATFHGRDVFAPTAAVLASGHVAPADVGPVHQPVQPPTPPVRAEPGGLAGCVTYVDRFGNAVTNVPAIDLPGFPTTAYTAIAATETVDLVRTYADVAEGTLCAVVGSEGFVEIAIRGGNATARLRLKTGSPVRVLEKGARR